VRPSGAIRSASFMSHVPWLNLPVACGPSENDALTTVKDNLSRTHVGIAAGLSRAAACMRSCGDPEQSLAWCVRAERAADHSAADPDAALRNSGRSVASDRIAARANASTGSADSPVVGGLLEPLVSSAATAW
jgi:hypothetical protein